jgi:hypothetical protein
MKKLLAFLLLLMLSGTPALADSPTFGGGGWGIQASCATITQNGVGCWDNDNFIFYIGNGTLAQAIGGTGYFANPMFAVGDIIYGGTAGAATRLAPNTAATRKILEQTGTGSAGQAPTWCSVTGTGDVVLATSPTLVTPTLGAATATSINKVAVTAPATSATVTIIDGTTFSNAKTIVAHSATESTTAPYCYGHFHTVTGAYAVTLPTAVAGMHLTFHATTAAVYSVNPADTDVITLSGTALTAGNRITTDGSAGCQIELISISNGTWTTRHMNCVVIDGGA